MVLKRIQCARRELLWEHSAFFTGEGCGFDCGSRGSRQSSLPVQSCFWEASPGYQNSFLQERSNSQRAEWILLFREERSSKKHLKKRPTPLSACPAHSITPQGHSPPLTHTSHNWWHLPAVPRSSPVLCSKPGHTPCSIPGVLGAGSSSSSGVRTAGVNISVLHVLVVGQDFHKTPRLHPWVYT